MEDRVLGLQVFKAHSAVLEIEAELLQEYKVGIHHNVIGFMIFRLDGKSKRELVIDAIITEHDTEVNEFAHSIVAISVTNCSDIISAAFRSFDESEIVLQILSLGRIGDIVVVLKRHVKGRLFKSLCGAFVVSLFKHKPLSAQEIHVVVEARRNAHSDIVGVQDCDRV